MLPPVFISFLVLNKNACSSDMRSIHFTPLSRAQDGKHKHEVFLSPHCTHPAREVKALRHKVHLPGKKESLFVFFLLFLGCIA